MPTRRQEKIARVVKEAVSDAIANHLSDPRIEAFVSVTRVEVSADMRIADVYLSMFGGTETAQNKTFAAILHARSRIQTVLAEQSQSRFCPVINIHRDENFKKSLEIMKLIDGLAAEFKDKDSVDQEHD
ncbi:MAG: 30S ribosome-binding factor RbfA [Planctomycetes bacterium]|nr:30S ribosome-binding factor RbfA [Planctomycetota bacterium]